MYWTLGSPPIAARGSLTSKGFETFFKYVTLYRKKHEDEDLFSGIEILIHIFHEARLAIMLESAKNKDSTNKMAVESQLEQFEY